MKIYETTIEVANASPIVLSVVIDKEAIMEEIKKINKRKEKLNNEIINNKWSCSCFSS